MGDENPIRTLGDYSKPSHEGYMNTIELPIGNNMVSLRSDTIRLVQNGCSFHRLRSEDPNQHLKDFLKLVDSLDLDGENRERTRLRLFQFSLRDQPSNWLKRLPAGSITTWEDFTIRFLALFFPAKRTLKLRNDILIFQQHHEESLSEAWTRFKDLLQKVPRHGIDHWLQIQKIYDHVSFHLKYEIDRFAGGKLRNKNVDKSWEIIENLAFYDHEGTCPSPQPQALETTFEARVRDYMAAHTKRMERFENAICKQREGINRRMTEIFVLLKELMTSRTPEKVTPDNTESPTETKAKIQVKEAETRNGAEDRAENKSIKTPKNEEAVEAPSSQPVAYYLKHKINEKLIEGLVDSNRFNNSVSGTQVGKKKGKTYKVLPRGPVYDEILKKKRTKKEDIERNFEIPCNVGGQKGINTLVDQGSDVNVMPCTTYMKLTDERPAETNIRLSLASHSYIYPLGIIEDVLVEVPEHVYPVDFMILDIKENEKRPFILGTLFLTMAKATIKFDKGTITLISGKSKVSFHRIPDPLCMTNKRVKNDIVPIAPTMTVNLLVLEWEENIRLHLEIEMKFNQLRRKGFKGKHPTLMETKEELEDEGEVT
nr:zinc finger, CCHC-type [Tanacetum cinerariifolium]